MITGIPQCWWSCFRLEKTFEKLVVVVCQNNCMLWCFPSNEFKFKKFHVHCQKNFELMDFLSWVRGIIINPNATRAFIFRFVSIFWSGLSWIRRAYPALLKLASVLRTSCLPGMGCSVLIHKHHWPLFWLNQIFPSTYYWLALQFQAICGMIELFTYPGNIQSVIDHDFQVRL